MTVVVEAHSSLGKQALTSAWCQNGKRWLNTYDDGSEAKWLPYTFDAQLFLEGCVCIQNESALGRRFRRQRIRVEKASLDGTLESLVPPIDVGTIGLWIGLLLARKIRVEGLQTRRRSLEERWYGRKSGRNGKGGGNWCDFKVSWRAWMRTSRNSRNLKMAAEK